MREAPRTGGAGGPSSGSGNHILGVGSFFKPHPVEGSLGVFAGFFITGRPRNKPLRVRPGLELVSSRSVSLIGHN